MHTDYILNEIKEERKKQDAKWGEQNHSPAHWLMILGEEVGEVNKAALEAKFSGKDLAQYREELIQVAAVAVAMIECLDRNNFYKYPTLIESNAKGNCRVVGQDGSFPHPLFYGTYDECIKWQSENCR